MAKAVCDRCGFVIEPHTKLKKEWTNFLVCGKCYDRRPPDTRPPRLGPEGIPIRDARPEPEPVFRDPDELGGSDL